MDTTNVLKSLRGKKLKTQQEIADKLGVSRQIYNGYENDILKCNLNLIVKILNTLEATDQEVEEFFNGLKQDFLSYKNM